jgi:hypothetical protein
MNNIEHYYEFLSNPETLPDLLKQRSEEGSLSPFPIMGLGAAEPVWTATGHPGVYKKVVAAMGIEHLGQIQVTEGGTLDNPQEYHMTKLPEMSSVRTTTPAGGRGWGRGAA